MTQGTSDTTTFPPGVLLGALTAVVCVATSAPGLYWLDG